MLRTATLLCACVATGVCGFFDAKIASAQTASPRIVYRVDRANGYSYLTTDINDAATVMTTYGGTTMTKLGTCYSASVSYFNKPIYHLVHPTTGIHFYTIYDVEKDNAVANLGYQYQNIIGYAKDFTIPGFFATVYRYSKVNTDVFIWSIGNFKPQTVPSTPDSVPFTIDDSLKHSGFDASGLFDAILAGGTYTRTQAFQLAGIQY